MLNLILGMQSIQANGKAYLGCVIPTSLMIIDVGIAKSLVRYNQEFSVGLKGLKCKRLCMQKGQSLIPDYLKLIITICCS